MAHRYEAYKRVVVKPFFINHFARLDRQIVLVDTLAAINAGPARCATCAMRSARSLPASRRAKTRSSRGCSAARIDRIVFAATKADHLHQRNHGRLEALMQLLTERAIKHATSTGATVDAVALASLRATREGRITRGGQTMDCIIGTPQKGQTIGGETFDGKTEAALFPGDLPEDPRDVLADPDHAFSSPKGISDAESADFRFLKFRPPALGKTPKDAEDAVMPHIRLDRTLEFLLGDRLA
jgi:predicted YcjX-like family ATPase